MPPRANSHKWNDVQTAIAAVTVVATLGLWNLFARPAKPATAQAEDLTPPSTEPPLSVEPTAMPQVKIMFTQIAPQSSTTSSQQPQTKKKKKNNNNGGGGTVTQTKSS